MKVKITQTETKGHAFRGDESKPLTEMTYSVAGTKQIIIDHTEVDESLKGTDAGHKNADGVHLVD